MRVVIGAVLALALLASHSEMASAAPVVYCGVVKANSITSGQGSDPRTYELEVMIGPGGGGRFSVPESIALPAIGSYICGQFEQGVPMNGLVAFLGAGDPGYVPQPTTVTPAPPATVAACGALRGLNTPTGTNNVGSATVADKIYPLSGTPGPNNLSPLVTIGSNVCLTGQIAQVETGPAGLLIRWSLVPEPLASPSPSSSPAPSPSPSTSASPAAPESGAFGGGLIWLILVIATLVLLAWLIAQMRRTARSRGGSL